MDFDLPEPSEGPVLSRRHILAMLAAAGVVGSLPPVLSSATAHASVPGFGYRSQADHANTGILWGYPFTERVERRDGVDGYPGPYYEHHKGVDYYTSPREGFPIHCVADGVVIASRDEGEEGWVRGQHVVVQHAGGFTSEYAHMTRGSQLVSRGDQVRRGTKLGLTGWTGSVVPKTPSNAHLHISIRSNDQTVLWNPVWLIDNAPLANSPDPTPDPPLPIMEDDMPINFRSTTGGVSWTMVPGILITRHYNETAADFTNYVNTGKTWVGGAPAADRELAGERQLSDAQILMILPHYGFRWMSQNIARLPDVNQIGYSDAYRVLLGLGV